MEQACRPLQQPLNNSINQASHACGTCESVIQRLIKPDLLWTDEENGFSFSDTIQLGWLDSITANRECSLCRLVRCIYDQTQTESRSEDSRIYCLIDSGPTRLTPLGIRRDWNIELRFIYKGQEKSTIETSLWTPAFQLVADDAPLLGIEDGTFQHGRIVSSVYPDPIFIRNCIDICRRTHGRVCENPSRSAIRAGARHFTLIKHAPQPTGMRVIDTAEDRVTFAPPNCDYVALSYLWGSTNFLKLIRENQQSLTAIGALRNSRPPKTIMDAMQVTRMLGQRYLWVDSLCICQDDVEEKTIHIQKMDGIYSRAMLTIVGLDQSHADAGLWRHGSSRRRLPQAVEEVCGLRFAGTAPTIDRPLESSAWVKRGWTYQEYALSKRLLFFTEQQTYFSCETSAFAEDYVHQVHADGGQEMQHFGNDETLRRAYQAFNYPTYWPALLHDYTKRALTFESDGLNAVLGVLENYGSGMQDGFICGLPVSTLFESSLLWYASVSLRRRGPTTSGKPFPSWSWVGWVGEVSYEEFEQSSAILDARIISEWSLEHDAGLLRNTDLHFPSAPGQLVSLSPEKYRKRTKKSLQFIQTGVLCFKTKSARFAIDEVCWTQFVFSNDPDCRHSGLYKIFSGNIWIGSVHLEHATAKELAVGPGSLHEFIVLSKTGGRIQPLRVYGRELDREVDSIALYSEKQLMEHRFQVYNVMLVMWRGAVAYRQGIGQIHTYSFDQSDWSAKEVRLG